MNLFATASAQTFGLGTAYLGNPTVDTLNTIFLFIIPLCFVIFVYSLIKRVALGRKIKRFDAKFSSPDMKQEKIRVELHKKTKLYGYLVVMTVLIIFISLLVWALYTFSVCC